MVKARSKNRRYQKKRKLFEGAKSRDVLEDMGCNGGTEQQQPYDPENVNVVP